MTMSPLAFSWLSAMMEPSEKYLVSLFMMSCITQNRLALLKWVKGRKIFSSSHQKKIYWHCMSRHGCAEKQEPTVLNLGRKHGANSTYRSHTSEERHLKLNLSKIMCKSGLFAAKSLWIKHVADSFTREKRLFSIFFAISNLSSSGIVLWRMDLCCNSRLIECLYMIFFVMLLCESITCILLPSINVLF